MSPLAPNLFDRRRFQDLMAIGRARLPSLAPEWTDHNAHDPGITLMELLAWVAEAQLYSLSRMRRDERVAYAALLGLAPGGTRPARGLIWPDRHDPRSPVATSAQSLVIPADAVVNVLGAEAPTYRPTHRVLWVPGRIATLRSRLADGRVLDHTAVNERGGPAFLPFGEVAGPRDVLSMRFECRGDAGLFPPRRTDARGAYWPIGVRADAPVGGEGPGAAEPRPRPSPLAASLLVDGARFPLRVESDSTEGLLRTGALVLDLSSVPHSPPAFTLELHAPSGFERPPRLLRIEPNVVPIVQGRRIWREVHVVTGRPDWSFELDARGLRFEAGVEPVEVEVDEAPGLTRWQRCDRLADQGPDDRVYELDAAAGRITFGNGINGRAPDEGCPVYVTYAVCDAEAGGAARNRTWKVAGFDGAFGVNPDAMVGGAAPWGWDDQRREARRRAREEHALVSSDDVVSAARALPLLEVARAWVVPPLPAAPRTGVVTLVAMRARPSGKEPDAIPETRRWLEAIRRRLASRMPLGSRLVVAAPRYVDFFIRASLEVEPGRDPAVVRAAVDAELAKRLAPVSSSPDVTPRAAGVPVARRDVAAWIRGVAGVRRVIRLELVRASTRQAVDDVAVPRGGLPRFDRVRSTIEMSRPGPGGTA
jgi:predicted phage baseplate assembly protein